MTPNYFGASFCVSFGARSVIGKAQIQIRSSGVSSLKFIGC